MGPMGTKGKAGLDGETGETGPTGGKGSIVSKIIFLRYFSGITDRSIKACKRFLLRVL